MAEPLILASGSATRAGMLRAAGVPFEVVVPRVDEAALKAALIAEERPARDIADALAEQADRYRAAHWLAAQAR